MAETIRDAKVKLSWTGYLGILFQMFGNWMLWPLFRFLALISIRLLFRYRIQNVKQIRKKFQSILAAHSGKPLLICANHFTYFDSILINWITVGFWRAFFHPKQTFWALRESHYFSFFPIREICYLGKCLFVERMGSREKIRSVLNKIKWLSSNGSFVVIFPEGKRSRTGYVDTVDFQYGVGEIVRIIPDCHVLCVYMRNEGQKIYGKIPPKNHRIDLSLEVFKPETQFTGLRATRDISQQIVTKLSCMEKVYFSEKRKSN